MSDQNKDNEHEDIFVDDNTPCKRCGNKPVDHQEHLCRICFYDKA